LRDLLLAFAHALVDEPRRASVSERTQGGTTVLSLSVAPEDRGKVIGREGRTASALRRVLDAVARRRGVRVHLEILG
jgi:hypothetical protein